MVDSDVESFEVEEIRNKRTNKKGKTEYLIKWKGYPEQENTWEPADNLQCFGMINEFEHKYEKKLAKRLRPPGKNDGFDNSWNAKRIMGVSTDEDSRIMFLIQWETDTSSKEEHFVYAEKANEFIPHMIIEFYESKLTWHKQFPVREFWDSLK